MSTLVVTTLLQASILAAGDQSYAVAAHRSAESGKPLLVLLGAEWCPACKVMRDTTMPALARQGGLKDVEYSYVDVDRNPDLMARFARGRSIPQLIRFEKKGGKWKATHLIGGQSLGRVTAFIDDEPEEKKPLVALPVSLGEWTRVFSRK